MYKYTSAFSLAGMVDSSPDRLDSYRTNINAMPTPDSIEDVAPAETTRGRPAKGKYTATGKGHAGGVSSRTGSVAASRKAGPSERAAAAAAAKKRPMMERRLKAQHQRSELDELDELDVANEQAQRRVDTGEEMVLHNELDASLVSPVAPPRKSKVPRAKAHNDPVKRMKGATITTKGKKRAPQQEEEEMMMPAEVHRNNGPARSDYEEKQEPPSIALDDSLPLGDLNDVSELDAATPKPVPKVSRSSRAPSEVPPPRAAPPPSLNGTKRKRVQDDATSDIETSSDPILRRKLGDVTRRYENLEAKHRKLREVGIKEADVNFERLKKQMQEKNYGMCYLSLIRSSPPPCSSFPRAVDTPV